MRGRGIAFVIGGLGIVAIGAATRAAEVILVGALIAAAGVMMTLRPR